MKKNLFLLWSVLLLVGCNTDTNHTDVHFIPVGKWVYSFSDYSDPDKKVTTLWDIKADTIEYDDGFGGEFGGFTGLIRYASDFNEKSGVLIVEYTTPPIDVTTGWTGVYYREYKGNSIQIADAYDSDYNHVVTETLDEAKETFSINNIGDHIEDWGAIAPYSLEQ
jgi:hypothetical protein